MKKRMILIFLLIGCFVLSACDSSESDDDTESPTATVAPTEAETPDENKPTSGEGHTDVKLPQEVSPTETPNTERNLPALEDGSPRDLQVAVVRSDTSADYGNREALNEAERALAAGEMVELTSGVSLYVDADDDRDTVTLKYSGNEETRWIGTYTLTCGGVSMQRECDFSWGMQIPEEKFYAAKLYGTGKTGWIDGIQLLVPGCYFEGQYCYDIFSYCHKDTEEILSYVGNVWFSESSAIKIADDGFYQSVSLNGFTLFDVRKKMTLCTGYSMDLLGEGETYDAVLCEVPVGMYSLNAIVTLQKDIFVYEYRADEPYAILPAGSTIACSATDGEEWFYFEDFYTDQSGWFRMEERGRLNGYVSAPESVDLSDAGIFLSGW